MGEGEGGADDGNRVAAGVVEQADSAVRRAQARSRANLAARVRAVVTAANDLSRELAAILTDIDDDQDILDMITDRESGSERREGTR